MRTELRICTMEDMDVLRELSIKTYYETFAAMNRPEDMEAYLRDSFDAEKLRNELSDRNSEFFFLYADGKLAGYMKLNEAPSQTDINDAESLEIERIYVSGEFQGMRLGRYMMERAIEIATERGKKYVWLGVWEKNENALRFYRKHGFFRIGAYSFFMGADEQNDYIMRRDLDG